eukprot:598696-Amphidinium_carterae.2
MGAGFVMPSEKQNVIQRDKTTMKCCTCHWWGVGWFLSLFVWLLVLTSPFVGIYASSDKRQALLLSEVEPDGITVLAAAVAWVPPGRTSVLVDGEHAD